MGLQEPPHPHRLRLIPVVRYSVEQRIAGGDPDCWDWAILLELEVLANDQVGANKALGEVLALVRGPFEPETTRATCA
ncbi:hypothetical protein [Sinorhizobium meliloti]|uniref:hypothetical protein n=1 Tax=Rhizobium meliloti TaxID=382 RepID=UPI0019134CCE|nr:hypothetical protein [Sinorhizobium meliloti]